MEKPYSVITIPPERDMTPEEMDLITKRNEMTRETWVSNALRIHPDKSREEAEALYEKLHSDDLGPMSGTPCSFNIEEPDKVYEIMNIKIE